LEHCQTALAFLEKGRPFALATVLKTRGSTPVKAGAKAIIELAGNIYGTVGGGAAEAEAQCRAKLAIQTGKSSAFEIDLHGPGVSDASPICGGLMRMLVMPSVSLDPSDYKRAVETLTKRSSGLWITSLRIGSEGASKRRFIPEDKLSARSAWPKLAQLRSCLKQRRVQLFSQAGPAKSKRLEAFIEPATPPPALVIAGGGHVAQAVAAQASLLGFEIFVLEDRPEFAEPALFPAGAQIRCGPVAAELTAFPIDPDTFIVLATRGHQQDALALRACIRRPAAYIGMIGSRRKVPLVRKLFIDSKWAAPDEFDRVFAPIGLDLGADTVAEIALEIVAQIIAVRRKGMKPQNPDR